MERVQARIGRIVSLFTGQRRAVQTPGVYPVQVVGGVYGWETTSGYRIEITFKAVGARRGAQPKMTSYKMMTMLIGIRGTVGNRRGGRVGDPVSTKLAWEGKRAKGETYSASESGSHRRVGSRAS